MTDSVDFEVAGELFALSEKRATTLGENLFIRAKKRPGDYGSAGALVVARLIEDVLTERRTDLIPLEGEAAESVFCELNLMTATHGSEDDPDRRLYTAVRRLHYERLASG